MGKSYSKQEEIIIAQNGANNASQTTVEQKLETYGTVILIILGIILLFGILVMCKRCHSGVKKWARMEFALAAGSNQADKACKPATVVSQPQTVQYA